MENPKPGNDAVGTVKLDKKGLAAAKSNHDLHVLLVIRQDKVSKSAALVIAYTEGAPGLNTRLG